MKLIIQIVRWVSQPTSTKLRFEPLETSPNTLLTSINISVYLGHLDIAFLRGRNDRTSGRNPPRGGGVARFGRRHGNHREFPWEKLGISFGRVIYYDLLNNNYQICQALEGFLLNKNGKFIQHKLPAGSGTERVVVAVLWCLELCKTWYLQCFWRFGNFKIHAIPLGFSISTVFSQVRWHFFHVVG